MDRHKIRRVNLIPTFSIKKKQGFKKGSYRLTKLEKGLRSISATGDVSNGGHSLPHRIFIKLFNINVAAAFGSDASRLETAHIIYGCTSTRWQYFTCLLQRIILRHCVFVVIWTCIILTQLLFYYLNPVRVAFISVDPFIVPGGVVHQASSVGLHNCRSNQPAAISSETLAFFLDQFTSAVNWSKNDTD